MAKPTAVTESGGSKVLLLADATATTPGAKQPAAAVQSVSGEATYPVGWMAVATGADGEVALASAGLVPKDAAAVARAPIVLIGGKDFAASPVQRAMRIDESGILMNGAGGHAMAGLPLVDATAGGTVITNSVTETAISVIDASRFGYLCMIHGVCSVVGTNAAIATWTLKDGASGTVLWTFDVAINSPVGSTLGSMGAAPNGAPIVFPVPLKTNAINKQFTLTASVATLGTWRFHVNGCRSTL